MGWNNKNRPLTITFEFSQRQEFQNVTFTTFCQLDLGIQPFSQMLAYFSSDGLTFHPQYVKVVNKEPMVAGKAQNITLGLAKRIGRFVKLELYFDNKWLLISEVNFVSQSSTKMDVIDQAELGVIRPTEAQDSSEGIKSDDEVLSDTPGQPESSKNNGAAMSSNNKSNLRAKESNQVNEPFIFRLGFFWV